MDYSSATESSLTLGPILLLILALVCVAVCVGLAFIPSSIAGKKGYSRGGFWAFGFFAFVPALIVSLCIRDRSR